MSDLSVIDKSLTVADENAVYGVPVPAWKWIQAVHEQERAYDASDHVEDVAEHSEAILAALFHGNFIKAGRIIDDARQKTVDRRAKRSLS